MQNSRYLLYKQLCIVQTYVYKQQNFVHASMYCTNRSVSYKKLCIVQSSTRFSLGVGPNDCAGSSVGWSMADRVTSSLSPKDSNCSVQSTVNCMEVEFSTVHCAIHSTALYKALLFTTNLHYIAPRCSVLSFLALCCTTMQCKCTEVKGRAAQSSAAQSSAVKGILH